MIGTPFVRGQGAKFNAPARLATILTAEAARAIISRDISFDPSLNPYRGCEHGWTCRAVTRA